MEESQVSERLGASTLSIEVPPDHKKTKRRILRNVCVVSFGFLLTFTAFGSLEKLQSSLHSDERLGLMSLIVIYVTFVMSCLFVPSLLINKVGCKNTLMLAMGGYVTFIVANFYPRYWTLLPTSAIAGSSAAPLWTAKCTYVTTSGINYAKISKESKEAVISRFFGIFFLIFHTSQIWGNLISSLVLTPSGTTANATDMALSTCGSRFCPMIEASVNQSLSLTASKIHPVTIWTLMGTYVICGVLAIIVIFSFLDEIPITDSEKSSTSTCKDSIATFVHMKDRKMQLLIPITIFVGLENGFVFADFTKGYITCALGVEVVGFSMICFGASDAIFSSSLGKIVKYTGRPIIFSIGTAITVTLYVLLLIWKLNKDTVYLYYMAAGCLGLTDAIFQTQVNAYYGELFTNNQEAAFSNFRLWTSMGFVISFVCSSLVCLDVKLYMLIGMVLVGFVLYLLVETMRKKEEKSELEVPYKDHVLENPSAK